MPTVTTVPLARLTLTLSIPADTLENRAERCLERLDDPRFLESLARHIDRFFYGRKWVNAITCTLKD
jgi:hypothetical protein